jgi:hypothetical protein
MSITAKPRTLQQALALQPQDIANLAQFPSMEGRVAFHALLSIAAIAQLLIEKAVLTQAEIEEMLRLLHSAEGLFDSVDEAPSSEHTH